MRSFDSLKTEPENVTKSNQRKISIEDIETENDNIFGVFALESYTVIRGFIPGKQKNTRLHYTKIEPGKKVANVCIIPSYSGNQDNYLDIADCFAKQGMVVHILNIRGLASYSGSRLDCELEQMFSDIQCLLRCCEANLPIFLCSFGFGCTILSSLLVDNPHLPISGVILVSPSVIEESDKPFNLKRLMLKWFCRTFFGSLLVYLPLSFTTFTKNNYYLKRLIDEGSGVQYVKLDVLQLLKQSSDYSLVNAYKINYPVLLCYGLQNKFSSISYLQKYWSGLASTDKQLKTFEKGYHFLHCDEQKGPLSQQIITWINKRLPQRKNQKTIKIPHFNLLSKFPTYWTWKKILSLITVLYFVFKYILKKRIVKS